MASKKIEREIRQVIGEGAPRRAPRSSVRLIRSRESALREYRQLVSERPEGLRGDESARWFMDGFEFVRRDVLAGMAPEASFDLSTSARGMPVAFHDGASAARSLFNSQRAELVGGVPRSHGIAQAELAQAEKLANAYRVKLPK